MGRRPEGKRRKETRVHAPSISTLGDVSTVPLPPLGLWLSPERPFFHGPAPPNRPSKVLVSPNSAVPAPPVPPALGMPATSCYCYSQGCFSLSCLLLTSSNTFILISPHELLLLHSGFLCGLWQISLLPAWTFWEALSS